MSNSKPSTLRKRQREKRLTAGLYPRKEDTFFKTVIEGLEDYAIFTTDSNGFINSWNTGAEKILRYSEKEILGKNASVLFIPEDRNKNAPENELKRAVKFGKTKNERWYIRKDGSIFWGVGIVTILKDENGKAHGFIKIMRDLTKQKHSEQKLKEQASLLHIANDAFIVLDHTVEIKFWSKGASRLYGWSENEAVGKNAHKLLQTKFPIPRQKLYEILKNKKSWQGELIHTKKNGAEITVDSQWEMLEENNGSYYLEVNRDITERKRLEKQKDDFVSIATHELKTPVTSIKAYAQVLQRRFEQKNDTASANHMKKMDAQIDKLTNLISDLLDVTKIESGRLQFHQELFDFDALITEITEELQRTTEKHTLVKRGKSETKVFGDRDRIGQVLTNLLSNSIKYSPYTKKILISTAVMNGNIRVCVKDYGVGIPKNKQDKIFQRFYRVSGPTDNTFPGIGLGLYITHQIVTRMGGKIWLKSSKGKGATFCFTIPLTGVEKNQVNTLVEEELKHE